MLCGAIAFESPAIILSPAGNAPTRPSCCAGSRSSPRAASPAAVHDQRRHPVRGLVRGRWQVVPAAWSEASVELASVDVLPTNVWSCDLPGLARVDDRIVHRRVAELAVADEVDAREHRSQPFAAGAGRRGDRRRQRRRRDRRPAAASTPVALLPMSKPLSSELVPEDRRAPQVAQDGYKESVRQGALSEGPAAPRSCG